MKNTILNDVDFCHIPQMLKETEYNKIINKYILSEINLKNLKRYEYIVENHKWIVFDCDSFKMTTVDDRSYNCFFSKRTGLNIRFGKTLEDDPEYCGLSPEILDLEISVNGCVPVPGSLNCRYCYKNNTNAKPTNMTFETFKQIIDSFPKNLSQIAFGITGLQTNPDLEKMFKYCRQLGVIPNITTVGVDLNEHIKDVICKYAGACAVSCYTGAKQLCYKTIKELHDYAKQKYNRDFHVNMHIVVSKDNFLHLQNVLNDIAEKKVPGLKSVVLLRIKPKGRAIKMDCKISKNMYNKIIKFCLDKNISFGFDSCSAIPVMEVFKDIGKPELCSACEACESSKLSSYINVKGEYWSCSFAENLLNFMKPINVLNYKHSYEWWNLDEIKKIRFLKKFKCQSCPIYDLDGE